MPDCLFTRSFFSSSWIRIRQMSTISLEGSLVERFNEFLIQFGVSSHYEAEVCKIDDTSKHLLDANGNILAELTAHRGIKTRVVNLLFSDGSTIELRRKRGIFTSSTEIEAVGEIYNLKSATFERQMLVLGDPNDTELAVMFKNEEGAWDVKFEKECRLHIKAAVLIELGLRTMP